MQWRHLAAEGYKNMSRPLKVTGNMSCVTAVHELACFLCRLLLVKKQNDAQVWSCDYYWKLKLKKTFSTSSYLILHKLSNAWTFFKKIMCRWLFYMFRETTFQFHSLCTYQRPSRGVEPGEPPDIRTKTFTNSPYPGPIFFHEKLPLSFPPGSITWKDSQIVTKFPA